MAEDIFNGFFQDVLCGLPEIPALDYDFTSSCYSSSSVEVNLPTFVDYAQTIVPDLTRPPNRLVFDIQQTAVNLCEVPTVTISSSEKFCPDGVTSYSVNLELQPSCAHITAEAESDSTSSASLSVIVESNDDCENFQQNLKLTVPCVQPSVTVCGSEAIASTTPGSDCKTVVDITMSKPTITAEATIETDDEPSVVISATPEHNQDSCENDKWAWLLDFSFKLQEATASGGSSEGGGRAKLKSSCGPCVRLPKDQLSPQIIGCTRHGPHHFVVELLGTTILLTHTTAASTTWTSSATTVTCNGASITTTLTLTVGSCGNRTSVTLNATNIGSWNNSSYAFDIAKGGRLTRSTVVVSCITHCEIDVCAYNWDDPMTCEELPSGEYIPTINGVSFFPAYYIGPHIMEWIGGNEWRSPIITNPCSGSGTGYFRMIVSSVNPANNPVASPTVSFVNTVGSQLYTYGPSYISSFYSKFPLCSTRLRANTGACTLPGEYPNSLMLKPAPSKGVLVLSTANTLWRTIANSLSWVVIPSYVSNVNIKLLVNQVSGITIPIRDDIIAGKLKGRYVTTDVTVGLDAASGIYNAAGPSSMDPNGVPVSGVDITDGCSVIKINPQAAPALTPTLSGGSVFAHNAVGGVVGARTNVHNTDFIVIRGMQPYLNDVANTQFLTNLITKPNPYL